MSIMPYFLYCFCKITFEKSVFTDVIFLTRGTIKTGQASGFPSRFRVLLARPCLYILARASTNVIFVLPSNRIMNSSGVAYDRTTRLCHLSSRDNTIIQLPAVRLVNVSHTHHYTHTVSSYSLPIAGRRRTLKKPRSECTTTLRRHTVCIAVTCMYGPNKRWLHPQQPSLSPKLDNPHWYKHLCFLHFRNPRCCCRTPKTSVTDNRPLWKCLAIIFILFYFIFFFV